MLLGARRTDAVCVDSVMLTAGMTGVYKIAPDPMLMTVSSSVTGRLGEVVIVMV